MTTTSVTLEEVILRVVRGERPWTDLRTLGVAIHPEAGRADNLPSTEAKIDIHDLADGFAANRHDAGQLRGWAFTMQGLDADFDAVAAHPSGEAMWDAIWSASFGEPLDEATVRLVDKLARQDRSKP